MVIRIFIVWLILHVIDRRFEYDILYRMVYKSIYSRSDELDGNAS